MDINNKLKKLRKAKGLNQEQAATSLGVSLSSYQKYERDKNSVTPSLEVLLKLADFYNVSTDYLLGRQDKEQELAEELKSEFSMTALETLIVKGYLALPEDMRSELIEFLCKSVKEVKEESGE